MSHTALTLPDVPLSSSTWSVFEPVNLLSCKEIVNCLKPTSCPQDIISPLFLKQIFDTVGPGLLLVINKCLSTGIVPANLKHAVVRPYLKKPRLKNRGDRAFAIIGPKLGNSLPLHVKTVPSLSIFKTRLKTYLFSLAFNVP